jgi:diadenosine tetraphosphate (Ap4A) HIT family hydrolase
MRLSHPDLRVFGVLIIACFSAVDASAQNRCTIVPDLYEAWRQAVARNVPKDSVIAYAEGRRSRVRQQPDPFTPITTMSSGERVRKRETVVWEDDSVMVIDDNKFPTPKVLVVPKRPMNYIFDASVTLRAHIADVASAASDALMMAAGRKCGPTASASIYINPPGSLGVRQLHVHVLPRDPIATAGRKRFYVDVSRRLATLLAVRR